MAALAVDRKTSSNLLFVQNLRIGLSTSWQLIEGGYEGAKSRLSAGLQAPCIGGTYNRRVNRKAWFEGMSRPEQVVLDVKRRQPAKWIAVDDWPGAWPTWASQNVVRADPVLGIVDVTVFEDPETKLECEFSFQKVRIHREFMRSET